MTVPMTNADRLSPGFIDIFDLTPAEASEFEELIADVRREIYSHASSNAKMESLTDSKLVLKIPPYGHADEVADRFDKNVAAILGQERFAAYSEIERDRIFREFRSFGAEERAVSIERGADSSYIVTDRGNSPLTGTVSDVTILPKIDELAPTKYQWLSKYADSASKLKTGEGSHEFVGTTLTIIKPKKNAPKDSP